MTNTADYMPGEAITIVFDGCLVADVAADGPLTIQTAGPAITVDPAMPNVTIHRLRPADGVPQPGEVWADRFDGVWFARGRDGGQVVLVGADEQSQHPGRICQQWLDVHRELGPIRRLWAPPAGEDERA